MKAKASGQVHQEEIKLAAPPEQVRQFIMTPERILDYYPGAIEGAVIEPGKSFYCKGKAGISLLECVSEDSHSQLIVLKVYTAINLKPPYTAERIKAASFFTMIEDWELEACEQGTRLIKSWRQLVKLKYRFLPMATIVRRSARAESPKLKAAWDKAATRPETIVSQ